MTDDPVEAADAIGRRRSVCRMRPPAVQRRDVVLVTGPWLAGTTSLIAALRERMPEHDLRRGRRPAARRCARAVVFVVSAVAPLTESDCALLDLAAADTDLVIGVVSKIDAHRAWRDVLAADRALLAAHAPALRAMVPWVGVAAAPDLGEPMLDELVDCCASGSAIPMRCSSETGCGPGNPGCNRDRPTRGRRCGRRTAQARVTALRERRDDVCASGGWPNRSAPSRCAARSSRRGFSCRTSRATGARRCAPNCRRTPRS